jgi:hypothetical protein
MRPPDCQVAVHHLTATLEKWHRSVCHVSCSDGHCLVFWKSQVRISARWLYSDMSHFSETPSSHAFSTSALDGGNCPTVRPADSTNFRDCIGSYRMLCKDKAIPVQAVEALRVARCWGSHIFRHSAHRWRLGCRAYAPAAFYPQEDSWFSFLLEAESTPGP